MLNCIIIDDEPPAIEILERYVEKIPFLNLIASYDNAVEAALAIKTQMPDLVFLDIQMPELSGMQLAKMLRNTTKVVFTTAYSQYAVESFEQNALDYLLKPISFERFFQACQKIVEMPNVPQISAVESPSDAYIYLKTQSKYLKILLNEIVYVESMGNYITVFTLTEKIVLHGAIKDFATKIPESQFMRVHKSYIIATDYIKSVEGNQIVLNYGKNNIKIPLGDVFRNAFYQYLNSKVAN